MVTQVVVTETALWPGQLGGAVGHQTLDLVAGSGAAEDDAGVRASVRLDMAIGVLLAVLGTMLIVSPAAISLHRTGYRDIPGAVPTTVATVPVTLNGYHGHLGQAYVVLGAALVIVAVALAFHRLRTAALGVALVIGLFAVVASFVDRVLNPPEFLEELDGPPTGAGIAIGTLAGFAAVAIAGAALFVARRRASTGGLEPHRH